MSALTWRNRFLALALFLGAGILAVWYNRSDAQDKKPDLTDAKYYGVSTCNKCHADSVDGKPGKFANDFVLMNEFTTWRTKDKHALAYLVLEGPRGQQIGKLLNIDVTKEPQCLNCHATTSRQDRKGKGFNNFDGVSCDGCHGPAQHWIIDHALDPDNWRYKTPEEKEELGMYDVRNPVKRAQLCASCHVGNATEGKVVTHAMYAAGHPPLGSFEVASFSRNLPQHWSDFRDVEFFKKADDKVRKQNYGADAEFQNTKLMLIGGMESLRSMMELVASRATLEGKPAERRNAWPPVWLRPFAKNEPHDRWPEITPKKEAKPDDLQTLWPEIVMAQSDCYACHHELKSKSWRQLRGYTGRPGRPQLMPWPMALAGLSDDLKDLTVKHKKLLAAFDAQPFGIPKDVATAAGEVEACAAQGQFNQLKINKDVAMKVLDALLAKGGGEILDYDSARQVAWATRIVASELKWSAGQKKTMDDIFIKLDNELNLSLESDARKSFVSERYALTKELGKSDKEFAAKVKDQTFLAALQKISDAELREALARISNYDPLVFKGRMEELRARLGKNDTSRNKRN